MPVMEDYGVHVSLHLASLRDGLKSVPAGLVGQLAGIAPTLKKFDTRMAEIDADDNLTLAGKSEALKSALDGAVADIEKWRSAHTDKMDAQMFGLRTKLQEAAEKSLPKPTDVAVSNMVERLRGFDPLEIEVLYSDATDEERLVMEAAADAVGRQPVKRGEALTWEPIVPPDRVAETKEARIARANPDGVAALRDLQRIRNTYDILAGSAKQLLTDATPVAKV